MPSTNRHSFIRSLKRKGLKEAIVIKIGLYDLVTSTTLESNKSPSPYPLPRPGRGPGVGWYRVGLLSQALLPPGAGPQPVLSAHLPDGAAAGRCPGAPQYAGAVPPLARPCCLAPVTHDLAADGVGGLRQAATARAAAGAALPGPLHASGGHHESAAPRL